MSVCAHVALTPTFGGMLDLTILDFTASNLASSLLSSNYFWLACTLHPHTEGDYESLIWISQYSGRLAWLAMKDMKLCIPGLSATWYQEDISGTQRLVEILSTDLMNAHTLHLK